MTELITPLSFKGETKLTQLPNGLTVLLISEPTTQSSCCLNVKCGSHADNTPGTAHLLEHMIFQSGELQKLADKLGGSINAATTGEYTSFQFECPDGCSLDEMITIFASMFVKPVFKAKPIDRESHLVNNEHLNNKRSVNKLLYQGLRLLSDENHQFHNFSTGNDFTLRKMKRNLPKELNKLFNQYYKPNNMTLVLRCSHKIDYLYKLALKNFNYQKSNTPEHEWSYNTPVFTKLPSCLLITAPESITSTTVRISFPISYNSETHFEVLLFSKAWCYLYGDETQGSICHYLKQQDLIISLSAFTLQLCQAEINLTLELEMNSLHGLNTVLNAIFQFTSELSNCDEFLYELTQIDKLNYLYQLPDNSPMDEALSYLRSLHDFKVLNQWCLKGSSVWDLKDTQEWIEKGYKFVEFVKGNVTQRNYNIMILSQETQENYTIDPYFDFKYCQNSFNYKEVHIDYKFQLPQPNQFIPPTSIIDNLSNDHTTTQTPPTQLQTTDIETWFAFDNSLISKSYLTLDISNHYLPTSVETTIYLEFISELTTIRVQNLLYPSESLDYTWLISPSGKGKCNITITVGGFTLGVSKVICILLQSMRKPVTLEEFERVKASIRGKMDKLKESNGMVLGTLTLMSILEQDFWNFDQRLDVINGIELKRLIQFTKEFFGLTYLKSLYHGDLDTNTIHEINQLILNIISNTNTTQVQSSLTYTIPPGKNYIHETSAPPKDPTNTLVQYIQTGDRSHTKDRSITALVGYMLSLNLVYELREVQQLGYVVFGGLRVMRSTIGVYFNIISGEYSPMELNWKVDEYLQKWCDKISIIGFHQQVEKFCDCYKSGSIREAIISLKSTSAACSSNWQDGDTLTRSEHQLYWEQLTTGQQLDLKFIKAMSYKQFMQFIQTRVSPKSHTRATISVYMKSTITLSQQLQMMLSMNKLEIDETILQQIVDDCHDDMSLVMPKLVKYFIGQGKSFKIISLLLKETYRTISIKHPKPLNDISLHPIIDIDKFHQSVSSK